MTEEKEKKILNAYDFIYYTILTIFAIMFCFLCRVDVHAIESTTETTYYDLNGLTIPGPPGGNEFVILQSQTTGSFGEIYIFYLDDAVYDYCLSTSTKGTQYFMTYKDGEYYSLSNFFNTTTWYALLDANGNPVTCDFNYDYIDRIVHYDTILETATGDGSYWEIYNSDSFPQMAVVYCNSKNWNCSTDESNYSWLEYESDFFYLTPVALLGELIAKIPLTVLYWVTYLIPSIVLLATLLLGWKKALRFLQTALHRA